MRTGIKILLLVLIPASTLAQTGLADSLKSALKTATTDSVRLSILGRLAQYYHEINWETALKYDDQCLEIARKNNRAIDEAAALSDKGYILMFLGKYPESLQCLQTALAIAEDTKNENTLWYFDPTKNKIPHKTSIEVRAAVHFYMGLLMGLTNNTDEEILHFKTTKRLEEESGNIGFLSGVKLNLGQVYLALNRLDSALVLEKNAERMFRRMGFTKFLANVYLIIGNTYLKKGNRDIALQYFHKAVNAGIEQNNLVSVSFSYADLASYYLAEKHKDSSLYYAYKNLAVLHKLKYKDLGGVYESLYKGYKLGDDRDSAYRYQGLALIAKDSSYLATTKSLAEFQKLSFKAQLHSQELEKEKQDAQTRIRMYALIAAIGVFMLLAAIFYRNNRQKQKANVLLNQQKDEVQSTLSQLRSTQTQLIQSEKMASLGEVTAGIAHEIQNPLNFVNNFSEVNAELITELEQEIERGNLAEIKAIAFDIKENEKKIGQHGRRADFIVKGMLEHSRAGTGRKATD